MHVLELWTVWRDAHVYWWWRCMATQQHSHSILYRQLHRLTRPTRMNPDVAGLFDAVSPSPTPTYPLSNFHSSPSCVSTQDIMLIDYFWVRKGHFDGTMRARTDEMKRWMGETLKAVRVMYWVKCIRIWWAADRYWWWSEAVQQSPLKSSRSTQLLPLTTPTHINPIVRRLFDAAAACATLACHDPIILPAVSFELNRNNISIDENASTRAGALQWSGVFESHMCASPLPALPTIETYWHACNTTLLHTDPTHSTVYSMCGRKTQLLPRPSKGNECE